MIKGCGNGKLSIQLGNQSDRRKKKRDRTGRTLIENKLNKKNKFKLASRQMLN